MAKRQVSGVLLGTTLLVLATIGSTVYGQAKATRPVIRVGPAPAEKNRGSHYPLLSADGRFVVFTSFEQTLVPNDTNGRQDAFLHDRQTGQTLRVNVGPGGKQSAEVASHPAISSDGRYVVFYSAADDLVADDTNRTFDVFLYDRQSGQVSRVSDGPRGIQSFGPAGWAVVSKDGQYVAFSSWAPNLVPEDTNHCADVFCKEMATGKITRVSVSASGEQADGSSGRTGVVISADGRYILFESDATNLVPNDTNKAMDIFLYDRQTGKTTCVTRGTDGATAQGPSRFPEMSLDGRYITFSSEAANIGPEDTDNLLDVFVCDQQTQKTTCVSLASNGQPGNGRSGCGAISADGRYVVFVSESSNLVDNDTNGLPDVFLRDRKENKLVWVSMGLEGKPANGASRQPTISADGRFIAFVSDASNLVADDSNGVADVFMCERATGKISRITVEQPKAKTEAQPSPSAIAKEPSESKPEPTPPSPSPQPEPESAPKSAEPSKPEPSQPPPGATGG